MLTIILTANFIFADNTNPKTQLTKVTVYLNGAQITRTAEISLPSGTSEITFDKLSPNIQENSIQVSGLEQVSILSINYGINFLSKRDHTRDIENLKDQMDLLKDKIQLESDLISGYNEELTILQSNRQLGNDNHVVNLEKVQQFAAYYRKQTTSIKGKIYEANKKIESYEKDIKKIKLQFKELNADDKLETGEIKVTFNSEKATNITVMLKYNVDNAGWIPFYDLKAEKVNNPLQLSYRAHVYQNTGTDWNDVALTLSTSDPNTNNIKPDVNTKYLNFVNRYYTPHKATSHYNYKYNPLVKTVSGTVLDESGHPLPGVNVIVEGTSKGTTTDFDGNYSLNIGDGEKLQFSFVGYGSEILPIHSSTMNVNLNPDNHLDEVVVSAYRSNKRPNASFKQLLEGKIAGLKTTTNTQINLRGVASLSGNLEPLFVIDGVIIDESDFRGLNENQIESINVLKGSEALNVYGNRGSNGVVVITTKDTTSNGDIIEEGIANTRFEIQKSYSIQSDGDVTVIDIDTYFVPAQYQYFAAPVLNENVFLTAKFDNWEHYNLLPGEANIYFEGSYSGKTNINPYATTDSLTVSLGVDPNVIVKRNQLNNFKKTNLIGSNKIVINAYEIEVKNNKSTDIDLILMDRIPISQNKDIKIYDLDTGNSNYDDKKGLLEWKINLSNKQTKQYKFSYTVKFPKYSHINL